MNGKLLLNNFRIFTAESCEDFFTGYVLVEGEVIREVGKGSYPIERIPPDCVYIDGDEKILMPGLINCHTHMYSAFARGMGIKFFSPDNFRQLLEQLWWKLDKTLNEKTVFYSGLISAVEMVKNGVTTFIDHHSSPSAVRGSLKYLAKAIYEICGLKGIYCYETSDRDGEDVCKMAIEENMEFHELSKAYDDKIGSLFGLHASFTLSEDTLQRVSEADFPIHVHVGEAPEDGILHQKEFSMTPVERFEKYSILKSNSLLSHCINITEKDLNIIKSNNCLIVLNPQSNMNNGVGIPDYYRMKDHGIKILLGNDAYGYDFSKEIRLLPLTQRYLYEDTRKFDMNELYEVVFRNSSEYVSNILGSYIGVIKPGYKADIITYDYNSPTPITPENFLSHFYFGIIDNFKPAWVISNGRILKNENKICLPEKEIFEETRLLSEKIWRDM